MNPNLKSNINPRRFQVAQFTPKLKQFQNKKYVKLETREEIKIAHLFIIAVVTTAAIYFASQYIERKVDEIA